jgi:hypothetical protein
MACVALVELDPRMTVKFHTMKSLGPEFLQEWECAKTELTIE